MKAIGQATGRSVDKIKADIGNKGDLGIVAETSKSHQRMMFQPPRLMLRTVFEKLKEIALMTGHAVSVCSCSCKYLLLAFTFLGL